ncbi:unnamed protein product [Linum trigynum]|uniref:Uncharacterized protein n=1 Tax=Linum trigynum TaxID=586398 RepID=A0AAV2CSI9_9ROSI
MSRTQEGDGEVDMRIFDGAIWGVSSVTSADEFLIHVVKDMDVEDNNTKSGSHHFAASNSGVRRLLEIRAIGDGSYDRVPNRKWKYRKRDHHRPTFMSFYCMLRGSFFLIDSG